MTYFSKVLKLFTKCEVMYGPLACFKYQHVFCVFFMTDTQQNNVFHPTYVLSDFNKKECIQRLQKISVAHLPLKESLKKAAVLVPLCKVNNELSFLFTLRRSNLKRHKGQVSFPGGMKDAADKTLQDTAIRETEEELGIKRNKVDIWGSGNVIVGTEVIILPVLGYLGDVHVEKLKPNPDEVEVVFSLSLEHLCDKTNRRYTQFRKESSSGYVLPCYVNGQFRVWGMTALITHIVLCALLRDTYKTHLDFLKPTNYSAAIL